MDHDKFYDLVLIEVLRYQSADLVVDENDSLDRRFEVGGVQFGLKVRDQARIIDPLAGTNVTVHTIGSLELFVKYEIPWNHDVSDFAYGVETAKQNPIGVVRYLGRPFQVIHDWLEINLSDITVVGAHPNGRIQAHMLRGKSIEEGIRGFCDQLYKSRGVSPRHS